MDHLSPIIILQFKQDDKQQDVNLLIQEVEKLQKNAASLHLESIINPSSSSSFDSKSKKFVKILTFN